MRRRVLLIGWDAADWRLIHPLLDAGKLPTLERMINGGVMGNLSTLQPVLSPMLWTSIATGKRPFKHGIHGFAEPDPESGGIRPVTNLSRKTKAIWNILSQERMRSLVVGWWPSHPAEPIHGVMVSNHYQRAPALMDKPWPMLPETVYPSRLESLLKKLRLHPQELDFSHIGPFVPGCEEVDQDKDKRLTALARIIADCSSIHAAATALMQNEPWDFMAVYYDAIDHFGHGFMKYHPPRQDWVPEKDFVRYKHVMEGAYRYHDMMLEALLHLAGEDCTVLLMSDHGFHPDHLRPESIPMEPAGPASEHRELGIFVAKGPGIKKDELIHGASVLDVTPTILTCLGLPVGADMDGRPLLELFDTPQTAEYIASWEERPGEAGMHPPHKRLDPVESKMALDQLINLGYIERPDDDRAKAVEETVRELRYNLACSYMDAGRYADASTLLKALWLKWPGEYRFGIKLAFCYQVFKQTDKLRRLVQELISRRQEDAAKAQKELDAQTSLPPDVSPKRKDVQGATKQPQDLTPQTLLNNRRLRALASPNNAALERLRAFLEWADGHHDLALEHIQDAMKTYDRYPALHNLRGEILLELRRWQHAASSFQEALSRDPENADAHLGLCRTHLYQGRTYHAIEEALTSIGLRFFQPRAHYLLGIACLRLGDLHRAVEALEVSVHQNPNFAEAYVRLAYIYKKRLPNREKTDYYRQRAVDARATLQAFREAQLSPSRMTSVSDQETQAVAVHSHLLQPQISKHLSVISLPPVDKEIVVVTGLPRTGTSMMMQMLQAGGLPILTDQVRRADESNPNGYYEYEKSIRLQHDRAWIVEAQGKGIKIVAQLLTFLPYNLNSRPKETESDEQAKYTTNGLEPLKYRVVFMNRDLADVLASQRAMLERCQQKGAQLPEERLKNVFEQQLNRVRRSLKLQEIPILEISFSRTMAEPHETAMRVNRFLGSVLDERSMAKIVEPRLSLHHRCPP